MQTHWALKYSAIAFSVIVLYEAYSLMRTVPTMRKLLENFGVALPSRTELALRYYGLGSALIVAISLLSCAVILLDSRIEQRRVKIAYAMSLVALVAVFIWNDTILSTLTLPVRQLGEPI